MPAKSKKQRNLIAAAEHGATFPLAQKVRASMSPQQMHDFASTPTTDLPTQAPSAIPNTAPSLSTPTPPPPAMPRVEAVPGMMATRNALRGIRADSIRHIPKSQRRGK